MKNKSIYLCGSMTNLADFGTGWRNKITPWLTEKGYTVYDPCQEESEEHKHYKIKKKEDWEKFPQTLRETIILKDLNQIKQHTKFILCFFTQYSTGTVSELTFAFYNKIPILMVSPLKIRGWPGAIAQTKGNHLFRSFKKFKSFLERGKHDFSTKR